MMPYKYITTNQYIVLRQCTGGWELSTRTSPPMLLSSWGGGQLQLLHHSPALASCCCCTTPSSRFPESLTSAGAFLVSAKEVVCAAVCHNVPSTPLQDSCDQSLACRCLDKSRPSSSIGRSCRKHD